MPPPPHQTELLGLRLRAWLWRRRWVAAGLLVLFVLPRLFYYSTFQGSDFDLGVYHNLAGNLASGRGFHSDLLGYSHLAEHWNPVMLAFVPLYRLWPSAQWLMLAQGVAAAATVLGLLWIAELHLGGLSAPRRRWAWLALLGLFVIYRPFASAWWFSFQPILLGAPFLAWSLVFLHLGRWRALAIAVAVLLITREAAVLSCFGLAWYAWRVASRPRAAIVLTLAATLVAILIFAVVMPWAQAGHGWDHAKRVGVFADPGLKAWYLVILIGGAGFLPLAAPTTALAALPAVLLQLVVARSTQYSGGFHYDAQLSVFLLAAAAQGAGRLLARAPGEASWLRFGIPHVLVLGLIIAFGDVLPLRKFVAAFDVRRWQAGIAMERDLATALVSTGVDPSGALAADPVLGPHLRVGSGYVTMDCLPPWKPLAPLPAGTAIVVRRDWWRQRCLEDPRLAPLVIERGSCGGITVLERVAPLPSDASPPPP